MTAMLALKILFCLSRRRKPLQVEWSAVPTATARAAESSVILIAPRRPTAVAMGLTTTRSERPPAFLISPPVSKAPSDSSDFSNTHHRPF